MTRPDPAEIRVRMMINEAHDALNKAAAEGHLSTVGGEARQFCAQALGMVAANGGRWDEHSAGKIRAARDALTRETGSKRLAEFTPDHAHKTCCDAVRLLEFYLKTRLARGRREIRNAARETVGTSSREKETWSTRTQALAGLRGTTNRKKGVGY